MRDNVHIVGHMWLFSNTR